VIDENYVTAICFNANKINTYGRDSRSLSVGRFQSLLSVHCDIVVYHWNSCIKAQYLMQLKIEDIRHLHEGIVH